jgi:hypothetical protein|tara:strand:- start:1553 stop:1699 length:147 start_codon:yes stop_codon:yes gene_type:complete
MTIPLDIDELMEFIPIIQTLLKADEAGPGFFVATKQWKQETKQQEATI